MTEQSRPADVVAFVPMRHFSRRVPGKNYRPLGGRPLYHHVVEHLLACEYVREVVEDVAFQARAERKIDKRSGVSQRLPITTLELVVSNAERRALASNEGLAVPRVTDVYAALPSITAPLAAARLSNICLTRSIPDSISSSVQFFSELLCSSLCWRGTSSARILR